MKNISLNGELLFISTGYKGAIDKARFNLGEILKLFFILFIIINYHLNIYTIYKLTIYNK